MPGIVQNGDSTSKTANSKVMKRPKKLIVCCDGTWMNSDEGWEPPSYNPLNWHPHRELQTPSNVTRISHAIKPVDERDDAHHPQIIYYQAGVGTSWSLADRVIGGGTGRGIAENVREAYDFLANNYTDGDQIFLLGFSRGAFTARTIGGLIGSFGLVKKTVLPLFPEIFLDWENAGSSTYEPRLPKRLGRDFPLTTKPDTLKPYLQDYRKSLDAGGMTRDIRITAIAVWDTVGSLGIPTMPWLQELGVPTTLHDYRWVDQNLGNHVDNAFQALALDEHRSPFSPTLWERTSDLQTILKQVWFPGVHSNVGGGYPDTELSDITLAWMMSQLDEWIDFDDEYITHQFALNRKYCSEHKVPPVQWGHGLMTESSKGITAVAGKKRRTPGCYEKVEYESGLSTGVLLENTNEYIHASVRARIRYEGSSYDGQGIYDPFAAPSELPPPLQDWADPGGALLEWKLRDGDYSADGLSSKLYYEYVGSDERMKQQQMYEDKLGKYEKILLRISSGYADEILTSNAAALGPSMQ